MSMLTSVSVSHFQSLHDVSVDLKAFTVIIGASSSGKSAFTRALKTLTSNQRGDSFITHGESQCVISAKTDRGTVALLRGKKNEYVVIPEDDPAQQKTYTKLAGNTPEEVSEFIGIPAKDPLNYSNQFDMPYLLTSSAAEVARTLGELTNVSVIFEASREANRQRLQASGTLKTRAGDYETLTQNLDKYKSLAANKEKLEKAEHILEQAHKVQTRIIGIEQLLARIKDIPEVPDITVPDISVIESKHQKLKRLEQLIGKHQQAHTSYMTAKKQAEELTAIAEQKQEEYMRVLREAGTCPTCNQSTDHVH